MGTMKIVYVGYDAFFYCLQELEAAGGDIVAVHSYPVDGEYEHNCRLRAYATEKGIPFSTERLTAGELQAYAAAGVTLMFSAGYIYRIPVVPELRQVNFHPAPLPEGRGPWPMPVAILRGMTDYGAAIHTIAAEFDTGAILSCVHFSLSPDENLESLCDKIEEVARPMVRRLLPEMDALYRNAVPQSGGSYWKNPPEENIPLTEQDPPEKIDRTLRAFYGYRTLFATRNGLLSVVRGRYRRKLSDAVFTDSCFPFGKGYVEVLPPVTNVGSPK